MDRDIKDSKRREELSILTAELSAQEFVNNLPDYLKLIEFPQGNISCENYAIETDGARYSLSAKYPKLKELKEGDLALYYAYEGGTVHVGRIQSDGSVTSKWGNNGAVLKHKIDDVPYEYGYYVFFRRVPDEDLQKMKNQENLVIE